MTTQDQYEIINTKSACCCTWWNSQNEISMDTKLKYINRCKAMYGLILMKHHYYLLSIVNMSFTFVNISHFQIAIGMLH